MARILVVDDSPTIRETLDRILKGSGHTVLLTASAKELEKLVAAHRPDLIILDVVMPDRDGLEALMCLRRETPDLPVIVISGGGRQFNLNYLSMVKGLGATETLAKPFDPEILLVIVDQLLSSDKSVSRGTTSA